MANFRRRNRDSKNRERCRFHWRYVTVTNSVSKRATIERRERIPERCVDSFLWVLTVVVNGRIKMDSNKLAKAAIDSYHGLFSRKSHRAALISLE